MNQKIKLLLSGLLLVSSQVFADSTLAGELFGLTKVYMPSYSPAAHSDMTRLKAAERSDDSIGLTVSLSGSYEDVLKTRSGKELARGLSHSSTNVQDARVVDTAIVANTTGDNVKFTFDNVEHRRFGATGAGCYALDNFYEGLWVAASVNVLYERNRLNFTVANGATGTAQADNYTKYLAGTLAADANQSQLTALKMESGKVISDTAVDSVNAMVGFRVVNNDRATVNVMAVAAIPTAFEHKREYLFQPTPGLRNFKMGAGVCANVKLVDEEAYAFNVTGHAQWRYGFARKTEKIVPQHKTAGAHHTLVHVGTGTTNLAIPLANLLAEKASVDVEPKNEFCASAVALFEKSGFGVAAGYRFHYEQEKTLGINLDNAAGYKFVGPTHVVGTPVVVGSAIAASDFFNTVPATVQHCVHADLTYLFSNWEFPLLVGVSGSYTFSHRRSVTPECWGVGLKAGVTF